MRNKKAIWLLGISCLAINAVSLYFFINRNAFGNFTRLVSYDKLYSPAYNNENQIKKWNGSPNQYSQKDLQEAEQLATRYTGIKKDDSTLTKIKKLGSWLRRSFSKCKIGKPLDDFEKLSPIEQYKSASRVESPIWCGTYGGQFLFFSRAIGITARYIESKGGADNHVVNESFIPELNQWVFSDLLNNVLYCKDSNHKILNTGDLLYRNSKNDTTAFIAYGQTGDDTMALVARKEYSQLWRTYFNTFNKLYFYYTTDLDYVYRPVQKTVRYIYPKAWFELFTLTTVSNTSFYFRILFLYAGIILLLIFIPAYLRRK